MLKIKWVNAREGVDIYLPLSFRRKYKLFSNKITFHFGSFNKKLTVKFKKKLSNNKVCLSDKWKGNVFIPEDLTYEFKVAKNSLHIGPMILWVAANNDERLDKRLYNLQRRIEQYVPKRGMICVCSEEGIDMKKQKIRGYYFQPNVTNDHQLKWKKATFSSPGAVFKRVPLSKKTNQFLMESTNDKMFNSYFFNKWEMWEWLSPDSYLKKHLPETKKLEKLKQINKMLREYPIIYVKPIRGSEGKKIINLKKSKSKIHIKDDVNTRKSVHRLKEYSLLQKRINGSRQYMIQQGVPTRYQSRHVDFRIYMQKNQYHKWKSSGMTARVSNKGSIITNLRCLDYWLNGRKALQQIFKLSKEEAIAQERKIIRICKRACRKVDEIGHYGDITIDFVVDKKRHVWILEMNLRNVYPVEDPSLAGKVKGTPFKYAMSIAGFPEPRKGKKIKGIR
ncbi:YheC/YheD family protein [Salipaludibacillus daqingensis]|uniref:YheC/YheD family endospore coat-associated protein n=1 Tax=Salipaludibacillus daqingensis TaxID=3041001 RepID=UPI002476EF5B|nr:YheC/YheD family protein [Salipaludibacillus daqingensis]